MPIRSSAGVLAFATLWLTLTALVAAGSGVDDHGEDEKVDLTLKRVFPEKSFWGPSATSASFSHDGRFAAFLYRSYTERRHGSDLYVLDTETDVVRRMTSATRMAEFQADAREVRDDREKKAKKAGVSLDSLAADQARMHGWPAGSPEGSWEGDASAGRGPIDDGVAELVLSSARGGYSGHIQIGLVRLPLTKGKFDAEARTLEATIEDDGLGVSGAFEAEFAEGFGSVEGTVTLDDPEQEIEFALTPKAWDEGEADGPRGVLGAIGERLALGDVVLGDDAEINDEKDGRRPSTRAPTYRGVQGYEWSRSANEMLVLSGGDIYRLQIDLDAWEADFGPSEDAEGPVVPYRGEMERLTFTRERESDVQYLPDGSGYTYLRDGALLRVSFGDHRIMQLDPELEDGEQMVGYRISPDQNRLVFLANRGDSYWGRGRQVTIVNYRDRFARAQQVTRHMPDDPWPDAFSSIYLYDLSGHETEEGTLDRVFTKRITGPRDILRVPEWSPDSARIAFAAYEQTTGLVKIMEAGFVEEEDEGADADGESAEESADEEGEASEDTGETDQPGSDETQDDEEDKPEFEIENAEVAYEFYHFGGPNTPRMIQPHYLADNRRLAFLTELSGYRQLHVLDPRYQQLSQLTEGQFEVYPFDISEDRSTIFATATAEDPNQEHVYAIDLESGDMDLLTEVEGDYSRVAVRDDASMVVASHIDFGSPREMVVVRTGRDTETTPLTESHPDEAHKLTTVSPEYFSYENRHGQEIHGHMFKPADWTPEDKRPLLIYVYGGPLGERKMATRGAFSASSYFFARYMTEKHGYVTATIDPRGASGYGAVFEKANFERVGEPQTEDLVDGARWLVKHAGVDEGRMALYGWSFGGFQTQMVMYTEPDVFAVGIAGAGPTQWYNYNSWYTTGTVGPHKPGEVNLKEFSLLPLAKNLTGRLLLVHGMEDANVLYQDTVNVYRELLKNDKEVLVELFVDPTGGHGLGGDVKTIGRYRKYEDFLKQHLGVHEVEAGSEEGESAEEEAEIEDVEAGEAEIGEV